MFCCDSKEKAEYANVNWDELGFGLTKTDYMYVMNCCEDEEIFSQGIAIPFGNIELCPSSGILNYGQVRKLINFNSKMGSLH